MECYCSTATTTGSQTLEREREIQRELFVLLGWVRVRHGSGTDGSGWSRVKDINDTGKWGLPTWWGQESSWPQDYTTGRLTRSDRVARCLLEILHAGRLRINFFYSKNSVFQFRLRWSHVRLYISRFGWLKEKKNGWNYNISIKMWFIALSNVFKMYVILTFKK